MNHKVLIIDKLHSVFYQSLKEKGITYDEKYFITKKELLGVIADYTALILRGSLQIGQDMLDQATNLKLIGRPGSGLDNIDTVYAAQKGIQCINSPQGNANAVGEHCVGLLIAIMNAFKLSQLNFAQDIWDRNACRGEELKGKTVGIIGYGHTGRSFAEKLESFSVQTLVYDKYLDNITNKNVRQVGLQEVYNKADIVSLHIPLNKETKHFANRTFFNQFKKPVYFLNTSRGGVMHVEDLMTALEDKKVKAAGLDVLEVEKFPDINHTTWYKKLIRHPHIFLTPHVAGYTHESEYMISKLLFDKIWQSGLLG